MRVTFSGQEITLELKSTLNGDLWQDVKLLDGRHLFVQVYHPDLLQFDHPQQVGLEVCQPAPLALLLPGQE